MTTHINSSADRFRSLERTAGVHDTRAARPTERVQVEARVGRAESAPQIPPPTSPDEALVLLGTSAALQAPALGRPPEEVVTGAGIGDIGTTAPINNGYTAVAAVNLSQNVAGLLRQIEEAEAHGNSNRLRDLAQSLRVQRENLAKLSLDLESRIEEQRNRIDDMQVQQHTGKRGARGSAALHQERDKLTQLREARAPQSEIDAQQQKVDSLLCRPHTSKAFGPKLDSAVLSSERSELRDLLVQRDAIKKELVALDRVIAAVERGAPVGSYAREAAGYNVELATAAGRWVGHDLRAENS